MSNPALLSNLARLRRILASTGAVFEITLDGAGGLRQIHDIDLIEGNLGEVITMDTPVGGHINTHHHDGLPHGRIYETEFSPQMPLKKLISTCVYDYLEYTDIDWYTEDGGFGTATINAVSGELTSEIYQRITKSVEQDTPTIYFATDVEELEETTHGTSDTPC